MNSTLLLRYRRIVCIVDPADSQGGGSDTPPETGAEGTNVTEASQDDWQAKFEAQQKVNRDLERKLKSSLSKDEAEALRAQIAKFEGKEAEYAASLEAKAAQEAMLAKANERIVARAVREHAATRLSDPADAFKFLDLTSFQVGEDGDLDDAAVKAAIDDLVKTKPYLAAQSDNPFVSVTAGREGQLSGAKQVTREELKSMSYEQIEKARKEGRLKSLGY